MALAAGGLAACSTMDSELAAARESWRGASYEQVVSAWGPPARSAGNSHTWLTEDSVTRAAGSSGGAGGAIFGGPGAGRCERTLAFRDGRVVGERWSGDAAFCKRFARR